MYEGKWIALFGWKGTVSMAMKRRIGLLMGEVVAERPAGVVLQYLNPVEQAAAVALRNLSRDLPLVGVHPTGHAPGGPGATVATLCNERLAVPTATPCGDSTIEGAVLSMARTKAKGSAGTVVLLLHALDPAPHEERMTALAPVWGVPVAEESLLARV